MKAGNKSFHHQRELRVGLALLVGVGNQGTRGKGPGSKAACAKKRRKWQQVLMDRRLEQGARKPVRGKAGIEKGKKEIEKGDKIKRTSKWCDLEN